MAASILLSRILGIIREIIIAGMFGQSSFTEAYNAAFMVPDLLFYLVAGGALSSAFIPVFSEYLHTDREDEAWHIFSSVTNFMAIVVSAFVVIAMIFTPQFLRIVVPGLTGEHATEIYSMGTYMARVLLPAQMAFFLGGILFGTLYSKQVFTVPGLGPNIYNLGIIFGAVVLSHFTAIPTAGMSWGATIGAFLGNILVPALAMRKIGLRYRFVIDLKHPGVRKVFKLMAPVVFGLSLPGVFALFLSFFASFYSTTTDSFISAFRNANTLMQAPLGVFGQSLALAAFPALSQFFAQGRMDAYAEQLTKTLRTVVYLTVPVSLILLLCPYDVVRAIYQHGDFTPADTARTAPLLAAFAVGVPFWCLQPVLMRAFFALQNTKRPILLGTVATAVFLTIGFSVVGIKYPPYFLALGGSIAAIVLVAMLLVAIKRDQPQVEVSTIAVTAGKSVMAAIPATAIFWASFRLIERIDIPGGKIIGLLIVAFFGIVSLWIYYFATRALKMPETAYFRRVAKRLERPSQVDDESGS